MISTISIGGHYSVHNALYKVRFIIMNINIVNNIKRYLNVCANCVLNAKTTLNLVNSECTEFYFLDVTLQVCITKRA